MASTLKLSLLSWHTFDSLLRGKLIASERVRLLLSWLAWQALCAAVFGLSLGVYGLTSRAEPDVRYMVASFFKMPLLLFFTSMVTCPSLYVFGALRGLRFSAREFAAMLMVAHTILAAVLGSLAPVVAFFALTTTTYSFMVLLTVLACGIAGLLGVRVFVKSLNEPAPVEERSEPAADSDAPAPSKYFGDCPAGINPSIWRLLGWWVILYVFVGAQMGWILRPFIGAPDLEFVLFRGKSGSFIEGVLHHIHKLAGG
jgi:hypothetical protein